MFVFLFGVLAPALAITNDHELAWRIAVAAAFLSGAVEASVSILGNKVRKFLPRPALFGALAGVALTFVAGEMLFNTFAIPVVGLVSLAIILVGFIGKLTMPFKIPTSLFAIIIGTILAFVMGYQSPDSIAEGLKHVGFYPILPSAFLGMEYDWSVNWTTCYINSITIYNAIETIIMSMQWKKQIHIMSSVKEDMSVLC